ncbi:MAG: hypothetical protein V8Q36_04050 [Anaerotignum sp.]
MQSQFRGTTKKITKLIAMMELGMPKKIFVDKRTGKDFNRPRC